MYYLSCVKVSNSPPQIYKIRALPDELTQPTEMTNRTTYVRQQRYLQHLMVAGMGIEPMRSGYEPLDLPLVYPAILYFFLITKV